MPPSTTPASSPMSCATAATGAPASARATPPIPPSSTSARSAPAPAGPPPSAPPPHPPLIYFRSVGPGPGWPAALGALLDLALIVEHWLDTPGIRGLAILLREGGRRKAAGV